MVNITDASQELTFGKYKGETVGHVLQHNPSYLFWCQLNIGWFNIENEKIEKEAEKSYYREQEERYSDMVGYIDHYDFCF